MRKNIINKKIETVSITDDLNVINQSTLTIQKHSVDKIYKLLSNNKINWFTETNFVPGYFNNKTNFRLGNVNSIYIVDKDLNILKTPDNDIENIMNLDDKFMIYPIPGFNIPNIDHLDLYKKDNNNQYESIILDSDFGQTIGKSLISSSAADLVDNPFIEVYNHDMRRLNKNLLCNSNPKFLCGILNGYWKASNNKGFMVDKKINIYSIITILNLLGASYSVRNYNNDKNIIFQLPPLFEGRIHPKFIKKELYIIKDNKIILSNTNLVQQTANIPSLEYYVNMGLYILIPMNKFDYEIVKSNNMYDLTSERADATNYTIPGCPILKNSDGDILGIRGIFTKEALKEAEKFSPSHKDFYKDLNDGEIGSFVADDAILGLYEITKHLK